MTRPYYTDHQRETILDRLAANMGNIALTSIQTGVSERTIARWRQKYRPAMTTKTTIPPAIDAVPTITLANDAALLRLRDQLVQHAFALSDSFEEGIANATLSQRAAALSQIIDRIVKLAAFLPPPDIEKEIVLAYDEDEVPDDDRPAAAVSGPEDDSQQ
jgi:hypothetical protein